MTNGSDGDARYLITNAVMPRLDNMDKGIERIFNKIDAVCTTQTDLMITDETIKAKIAAVEMMNVRTQESVDSLQSQMVKHAEDMRKHYNPHYEETVGEKLWRKKPEIATGVTLSSVIMAIILKLLEVI